MGFQSVSDNCKVGLDDIDSVAGIDSVVVALVFSALQAVVAELGVVHVVFWFAVAVEAFAADIDFAVLVFESAAAGNLGIVVDQVPKMEILK